MFIENYPTKTIPVNNIPSFHSKTKLAISGAENLTMNLNEIGIGVAGVIGGLLAKKTAESSYDKCFKLKASDDIEKYKKNLVDFLEENNYNEEFIKDIKDAKGKINLDSSLGIHIFKTFWNEDLLEDENLNIMDKIAKREFSPELDKLINDDETRRADLAIPLVKLLTKSDCNPEVIKIKNFLKKEYGQKDIYFNNDIEFAKDVLKAFEILEKNNIKYNGTIIAYDEFEAVGTCVNSSKGKCVIINKDNWQIGNNDPVHIILHEIIHSLQPRKLEFNLQEIPEKYDSIICQISDYANGNLAHEIHCELYVKKLTKGLSPEEDELFNYLGGTFLE